MDALDIRARAFPSVRTCPRAVRADAGGRATGGASGARRRAGGPGASPTRCGRMLRLRRRGREGRGRRRATRHEDASGRRMSRIHAADGAGEAAARAVGRRSMAAAGGRRPADRFDRGCIREPGRGPGRRVERPERRDEMKQEEQGEAAGRDFARGQSGKGPKLRHCAKLGKSSLVVKSKGGPQGRSGEGRNSRHRPETQALSLWLSFETPRRKGEAFRFSPPAGRCAWRTGDRSWPP